MGISPNLPLLSYGDTMGAWASTIGTKPELSSLKLFAVGAGGSTGLSGNLITNQEVNTAARSISGQQMKLIGRLKQGTGTSTDEFARFKRSLSRFQAQMQPFIIGEGAQIFNNANTGGIMEQDWVRFMTNVRETVKNSIDNFSEAQSYTPTGPGGESESINWGSAESGYKGLSACFPLKHIDVPTDGFTVGDIQKTVQTASGTQSVTRPARHPPNGDESKNLWENRSHDHLRLWVSMISLGEPETVAGSGVFQTFIFSATITSNLGIYHPLTTGLQQEDTGTIDFVPMSNKQVLTTNWPDNCADAGNITKSDRLEYMAIMGSALHGN
jgi:hypothetical protein